MVGWSAMRAIVVGAGLVGGAALPAQAQAYGYPYGYGYFGYRPYVVPFYRPRVLFVPPPVYVAPLLRPVRPVLLSPAVIRPRAVSRPRVTHRAASVCVAPDASASPFSGPGEGGVLPASVAPGSIARPAPAAAPRERPGVGDLPKDGPGGSPPPINVFPPETGQPGFGGF